MIGGAVWAIFHDLRLEDREAYLRWFHDVHIPEKLARAGYVSAGHYEVVDRDGRPASANGGTRDTTAEAHAGAAASGYVALFAGVDTAVFLDPSPAQIKPTQSDETRAMIGRRIGSRSFIAAREWSAGARTEADGCDRGDRIIVLSCIDTPGADEDFGAWYAQELRHELAGSSDCQFVGKYLAAVGPMKHATLAGFSSEQGAFRFGDRLARTEWRERIDKVLVDLPGSPLIARRLWPACP